MQNLDKRFVAGVLLGVVLTGWFVSAIEWRALLDALASVDPLWIGLACVVMLGEWLLRGVRWAVLVRQIDPEVRLWPLVSATLIGAALNTLIPLRGGDLVRPAVLARERNLPYTTVFSTTIVERLLDIFGVLCLLGAMVLTLPPAQGENAEMMDHLKVAGGWLAAIGVVTLLAAVALATRRARDVFERLLAPAPTLVRARVLGYFDQLIVGLAVAGRPGPLLAALLVTGAIWGNGLIAILCLFQGFGLDIPVSGALFTESVLALSVALPQAPGFVGVFHVVMERTLMLWKADLAQAQASALVFWAVSFGPVTIIGLLEAWRAGLGLTGQKEKLFGALEQRERDKIEPAA